MRAIFVRHGESEANIADVVNDDPRRGINLTALGREQAAAAAERLRTFAFGFAFVSEFPRAQQTARIILEPHGCPPIVDARLNERRSGMDGLPAAFFNDLVRPDPLHIRPPLGESFIEQTGRLRAFLFDLEVLPAETTVLAVSHEYPLRSVLALAGVDQEQAVRQPIINCGIVVVDFACGRWSLVPEFED